MVIRNQNRKGVAAVEFACVLPVIVIVLASALEIGCGIHMLSALQHAAREGARHSVVQGATQTSVNEVCLISLNANGIKAAQIAITPDPFSAKSGAFIQVTVSASAAENSWTQIMKLFGSKPFTSTVTMRKE